MLDAVVPPLIAAYAIFLLMTMSALRAPVARPAPGSGWLGPRRRGIVRHVAVTMAGGYLAFIAIVVIFHAWLASERGAIASAVVGGSALALVVFGLFAGVAAISRRRDPGAS
jgi:hypothetical protein